MGQFAYIFHFSPSELYQFTADDFKLWSRQLERIQKEQ